MSIKRFNNDAWRTNTERPTIVTIERQSGTGSVRYGDVYAVRVTREDLGTEVPVGTLVNAGRNAWRLGPIDKPVGTNAFLGTIDRAAWSLVGSVPGYHEGREYNPTNDVNYTNCSDCGRVVPTVATGEGLNKETCPARPADSSYRGHRVPVEALDAANAAAKSKAIEEQVNAGKDVPAKALQRHDVIVTQGLPSGATVLGVTRQSPDLVAVQVTGAESLILDLDYPVRVVDGPSLTDCGVAGHVHRSAEGAASCRALLNETALDKAARHAERLSESRKITPSLFAATLIDRGYQVVDTANRQGQQVYLREGLAALRYDGEALERVEWTPDGEGGVREVIIDSVAVTTDEREAAFRAIEWLRALEIRDLARTLLARLGDTRESYISGNVAHYAIQETKTALKHLIGNGSVHQGVDNRHTRSGAANPLPTFPIDL